MHANWAQASTVTPKGAGRVGGGTRTYESLSYVNLLISIDVPLSPIHINRVSSSMVSRDRDWTQHFNDWLASTFS